MAQGKQSDQKMKPYLVYEYLMRYSDANHVVSANELVGYDSLRFNSGRVES